MTMANAPASTSISTEPVVGWRIWNLSESESGPALLPAGSGSDEWPRRRPIEASCTAPILLVGRRRRHEVPAIGCRCGVYASRSLDVFGRERPAWPPAPVVGRASLWGRTIVHERGWRARFAYPERLRLECAVCVWVEPGTRVPSVVHAFAGRSTRCARRIVAASRCPTGAGPASRTSIRAPWRPGSSTRMPSTSCRRNGSSRCTAAPLQPRYRATSRRYAWCPPPGISRASVPRMGRERARGIRGRSPAPDPRA